MAFRRRSAQRAQGPVVATGERMSVGDWLAILGITGITVLGWVTIVRVWRHGLDVGWFQGWKPGTPQSAGYHAAIGAILAFVTVGTVDVWGIVATEWLGAGETADWVLWWVLVGGFGFWPLAGTLYLFLRPRFLVPPHLRDEPTVASTWRPHLRARNGERKETRPTGGKRARRRHEARPESSASD